MSLSSHLVCLSQSELTPTMRPPSPGQFMQRPCTCLGLLSHFTPFSLGPLFPSTRHAFPVAHFTGNKTDPEGAQTTSPGSREQDLIFSHSFQQTSHNKHGVGTREPGGFAGATPTNSGPGSKYSPDQRGAGSLVSPQDSPAVTSSQVWRWASQGHFCPSLSEQDRALIVQLSIPCHLNDLRIIGISEPSITSTLRPQ